jgi:nucleoside-diphosphate-sugar epimerase
MKPLICGAGGFIGGYLAKRLLEDGHEVRCADKKPIEEWFQVHGAENIISDLSILSNCEEVCEGIDRVYNLAADMGGVGYLPFHKANAMLNVLIGTHLLMASRKAGVERFFFASSACVYSSKKQSLGCSLAEDQAYPADPEDGYGWEKLFSERMCAHFLEDYGLKTRVARFQNCYGPHGAWTGGKEKAPAAICRKVINSNDTIEIWGDGEQKRPFVWIGDLIEGIVRITDSSACFPVNLGTEEKVTINELVSLAESVEGKKLERIYLDNNLTGPTDRSCSNKLIRKMINWEPKTPLSYGIPKLYEWIKCQLS